MTTKESNRRSSTVRIGQLDFNWCSRCASSRVVPVVYDGLFYLECLHCGFKRERNQSNDS